MDTNKCTKRIIDCRGDVVHHLIEVVLQSREDRGKTDPRAFLEHVLKTLPQNWEKEARDFIASRDRREMKTTIQDVAAEFSFRWLKTGIIVEDPEEELPLPEERPIPEEETILRTVYEDGIYVGPGSMEE
ncbi:hypothetical protein ACS0TY_013771 [Phlomoides rotata]